MLTTFKAKGLISDHHPLGAGVLGRSGTPVASWLMNESDLLIVLGASFSNHTGIAPYKPIVQVDFDPMALGRFHPVTVPVQGHAGVTARLLVERLAPGGDRVDQRADVAARWEIWRAEKARRLLDDRGLGVSSAAVFDALNRTVPEDAVMAVDVGNHAYSFGRYFECTRQSILMSGYLGSIGFGFPAAMGAWAAVGDTRKVVAVTGDGGFGQYLAEITTAVKYRMPITHVLLDNHSLGKITKEQRAAEYDVWHTDLHNPDFAAYAELCGAMGIAVHAEGRARRRAGPCDRARRPGARRDHHRPRAGVSVEPTATQARRKRISGGVTSVSPGFPTASFTCSWVSGFDAHDVGPARPRSRSASRNATLPWRAVEPPAGEHQEVAGGRLVGREPDRRRRVPVGRIVAERVAEHPLAEAAQRDLRADVVALGVERHGAADAARAARRRCGAATRRSPTSATRNAPAEWPSSIVSSRRRWYRVGVAPQEREGAGEVARLRRVPAGRSVPSRGSPASR